MRLFAVFVLGVLPIKIMWDWTVPHLAPGAVTDGLLAERISWFTALKLLAGLAVLTVLAGAVHHGRNKTVAELLGGPRKADRQEHNELNPEPRTPNPS